MTHLSQKDTARAGLIAALYVVLGLVFAPISFGVYQLRVAEALTVLPFLTRAAIPGLFVGCLVANLFGGQGWADIVFGPLLTLIAAFLTRMVGNMPKLPGGRLLALLPIACLWFSGASLLIPQAVIGIALTSFAISAIVLVVAVMLYLAESVSRMWTGLAAVLSLLALVYGVSLGEWGSDSLWQAVIGCGALLTAWLVTAYFAYALKRRESIRPILAPLPPVLVNAFGVAAYLAPLYGLDYWFAVQMVGVGQLIACYALGLPLLKLIQKRGLLRNEPAR